MHLRTWPYGTKYEVRVLRKDSAIVDGKRVHVTALSNLELNEAFVLIEDQENPANVGEFGVITFTRGGPTGGHWKYEPKPRENP
jgi:hypothetical protein